MIFIIIFINFRLKDSNRKNKINKPIVEIDYKPFYYSLQH
jgi:hypothetical protein